MIADVSRDHSGLPDLVYCAHFLKAHKAQAR